LAGRFVWAGRFNFESPFAGRAGSDLTASFAGFLGCDRTTGFLARAERVIFAMMRVY
jgi:hypothetical protein